MTETVLVVGAGTMGAGIAQVFAQAGWRVQLFDADAAAVDRGLGRVRDNLEGAVARGKLDAAGRDAALGRIEKTHGKLPGGASLAVEAIFEDLAAKKELFKNLDAALDAD